MADWFQDCSHLGLKSGFDIYNNFHLLFLQMQNSSSANVEDESEINVTTTGNGSQKWREDMLERTQNDKLKENKKKHKKKKSRSRSSDRSSPPSRTPQTATPAPRLNTHEDMYNNNKNISGIITSQSESNLTVMSSTKKLLSKPISSPDLKNHNSQPTIDSSPSQVNNSLKRKREQSMVGGINEIILFFNIKLNLTDETTEP